MSVLSIFKSKSVPPSHQRCHHHYDNGSRCRLPIDSASEHFCGRHLNTGQLNTSGPEREAELLVLYREVMGGAKYLNSATAVNHVLDNLFRLTLLGRIPQRIASKLTTQLRASLTSIRMKRDEYRVSQDDIETLLDDIDSHRESLESQVATHSDAAASDSDLASADASDQECSELEPTETSHQPRPANVAAGLDPPGFAHAETANISTREKHGNSRPRQIESLKQEANRADRDPFFDFLPQPNPAKDENNSSASGVHDASPTSEAVAWDLPEFSELRAAESRRRVADLVNGVWIGPKPNEINWDQLEQQIEYAEQINPTALFRRRKSRWWTTS